MTNNHKISLSICHGFQITYFVSQHFSIPLIIEFVEIDDREVKENISFRNNRSKSGMLLSTNILLALLRGEMQNKEKSYDIGCYTQHES